MTDKKPGGVIWAPGIHNVYVGGKPAKVFSPQYGVYNTYRTMQNQINQNGYIPLGFDHLPRDVLASNPILAKTLKEAQIDPYNVGKIKSIGMDGERIKIKDAEITNPEVQKLYNKGELPAYSIVGPYIGGPCDKNKADIVVDDFSQVKRVDFVMAGGCTDCRVDNDDNNGVLTAKLNMEDNTMTDEEIKEIEVESVETEPTEEVQEEVEEVKAEEEIKEPVEPEYVTKAELEDFKSDLTQIVTDAVQGKTAEVEAKLADMTLEAKKATIGSKIDMKIKEGFVTPAMRDGILEAGLAMEPEAFEGFLKTFKEKLWDGEQHASTTIEASKSEISEEEYEKRLGL